MSNKMHEAATAVERDFRTAETAADLAAANMARLLATTLDQRAQAGAAMGTGAAFVRHISRGLAAQIQAREEMLLAHTAAVKLGIEHGITGYGDTVGCPPDELLGMPTDSNVTALFSGPR
jgi:hypothetical protein